MGAWGITVRQSDDGLDLLDTIVMEQLRKVNFAVFNVSEAITLLNQTIQEAILVAECLYDYYQTGELVVYDYVGELYDPIEYHIKNLVVTGNDLLSLLAELESVQSPEHWKYQGWASEEILRQWLKHIQSVQQTLKEHA